MALRGLDGRGTRRRRFGAVVVAALVTGSVVLPVSHAQPAPDLDRAKDLYRSAEAAMKDGRFDDAARDYGAAYESSKDPALFFKIGRANERAGRCDIALIYYARYLREGKPSEQFTAATRERITACGGDVRKLDGSTGAGSTGADSTGAGNASASSPRAPSGASPGKAADASPGAPSAGAAPPVTGAARLTPTNRQKAAWLLTGGAVALATLGGVLAYATSSSENDVRDLYLGLGGQPLTFDAQTKQRYDDLVDQGHRYQYLSWVSFGLAGAAGVAAAILFVTGGRDDDARPPRVTPVVTTTSAGVAVRF